MLHHPFCSTCSIYSLKLAHALLSCAFTCLLIGRALTHQQALPSRPPLVGFQFSDRHLHKEPGRKLDSILNSNQRRCLRSRASRTVFERADHQTTDGQEHARALRSPSSNRSKVVRCARKRAATVHDQSCSLIENKVLRH